MTHNMCKLSIQYGCQKFKMVAKIEQIEQNEKKCSVKVLIDYYRIEHVYSSE